MSGKRWRVTFEIDQWNDNEWRQGSDWDGAPYPFLLLDQEVLDVYVPADAEIEDITPAPPLRNGYYRIKNNSYLFRRTGDKTQCVLWDYLTTGDEWRPSNVISVGTEESMRHLLIFIGDENL